MDGPDKRIHFLEIQRVAEIFDEKVADHNETLNHQLVDFAAGIAENTASKMHLVNVSDNPDEQSRSQLDKLIETIPDPDYEVLPVLLEGEPTKVLPEYAEKESVDLLVMGMLSRTGILGFFIGNTAEKIMDDINCSLLVVKPKEFVSQITV